MAAMQQLMSFCDAVILDRPAIQNRDPLALGHRITPVLPFEGCPFVA
jgi:hypothetical protein